MVAFEAFALLAGGLAAAVCIGTVVAVMIGAVRR